MMQYAGREVRIFLLAITYVDVTVAQKVRYPSGATIDDID